MKLSLTVYFISLLMSSSCLNGRSKRVLNGVALNGRPTTYKSIRYYGAIATAHWEPIFTFWLWPYIKNWGVFGWISCSGSLISPAIFQTACHCVATMEAPAKSDVFKAPTLMNIWEDRKYVYAGVSNKFGDDSMASSYGILTTKFIMHHKCGIVTEDAYFTHDYGLIVLDDVWVKGDPDKPYPYIEMEYAPQYTAEEIETFYSLAQKLQLVCLHVGFGVYDSSGTTSDVLLHGWAVLLTYRECFRFARILDLDDKDILKYYTWVCVDDFPKHNQFSQPGDSGGPVSCDGKYYAITSQSINRETREGGTETLRVHHADLKNNLFINAVNFRRNLLQSIYRLEDTYMDVTPSPPTKFRFKFQDDGISPALSEGLRAASNLFLMSVTLSVGHRIVYQ